MIEELLLPFQLPFMQYALAVAALISVPAAMLSCFLVLKGWSLMGDAVSHAVLPGVVLAYIVGLPLGIGAFLAGMGCALATGYLQENSRIKQDTVMGVVFSGMFALGLVIYTAIASDVHLDHILFGDILGIGPADLWEAGIIGGAVALALAVKWKDLLLHAFDPTQAKASGLPVGWLHYGLLVALSLTIVAALKAVGIILAIALLIAPGATAFLLTRRFHAMLMVSVGLALGCALAGTYASFWLNSAPAPTIVLAMTLCFIVAFLLTVQRARRSAQPLAPGSTTP
ncbi:metal ABC transporter permease [Oceanicola sp. 502str15]|uniref:metal ABC transporter permease n=1 Tax=Oceanicola sp. 502str15 TaxID=2696061 RepID=UPI0020947164|nr:metal ABC transporter permease [Oceanicola sp. 502str15]MCO6383884.1 hypothetical protein [Oceanicola sp. 502str15]